MKIRRHYREKFFESMISKDLFQFICGDFIGEGIERVVFEYKIDPSCVIKMQKEEGMYQNITEWDLWSDVQFCEDTLKWLAPCLQISPCGLWLIQKKTKPVPKNFEYPKKIPQFLTDLSKSNFGMYKGQLVSHDYARNLCSNHAMTNKMRIAKWGEDGLESCT